MRRWGAVLLLALFALACGRAGPPVRRAPAPEPATAQAPAEIQAPEAADEEKAP